MNFRVDSQKFQLVPGCDDPKLEKISQTFFGAPPPPLSPGRGRKRKGSSDLIVIHRKPVSKYNLDEKRQENRETNGVCSIRRLVHCARRSSYRGFWQLYLQSLQHVWMRKLHLEIRCPR